MGAETWSTWMVDSVPRPTLETGRGGIQFAPIGETNGVELWSEGQDGIRRKKQGTSNENMPKEHLVDSGHSWNSRPILGTADWPPSL